MIGNGRINVMTSFYKKRRKGKVFDIHSASKKTPFAGGIKSVINLRPLFYEKYRILTFGGMVIIVFLVMFFIHDSLIKAEVADFYPTTCLGTWQNTAKAQGEPENFSLEEENFSLDNSASFAGGDSRIFCGQFIPESYEGRGEIKSVGLTLIWHIGDTENPTQPTSSIPIGNGNGVDNVDLEKASDTPNPDSLESSFLYFPLINRALAQTSSTDGEEGPVSLPPPEGPEEEADQSGEEVLPLEENLEEINNSDDGIVTPEPIDEEETISNPSGAEESTTTEEIYETTTDETELGDENNTSTILSPPIVAPLEPLEDNTGDDLDLSSTTEDEGTSLPIALPPPPDEDFLVVKYSFDGENWVALAEINLANWENATLPLPITSWEEMEKIQISIEGIESLLDDIPEVTLDGMLLEVKYEILPVPASGQRPSSESNQENIPEGKEFLPPSPVEKIKDLEATQSCSVDPFSKIITKGESAEYLIYLTPSDSDNSFEISTGDLPRGVTSLIEGSVVSDTENGGFIKKITLNSSENSQVGSFNIVILYKEVTGGFRTLTNFCRLNLNIK